jgi:hypothetical protein
MSRRLRFAWLCELAAMLYAIGTPCAAEPLAFNRDVRLILNEHCLACHGPDSASRQAGLRLDQRDPAIAAGAITPGKLDESGIIKRITSTDPDLVMPPPEIKKPLKPAQIETLSRWITKGAPYQPHWSLIAPTKPTPPQVANSWWARNPIDRFIAKRLELVGLTPAPEAAWQTLIRRVCLDLTGLPPTPEILAEFGDDTSSGAYENLVDRLLASPQWGEHRGRAWLDVARYGDTHGIHFDNYREMWTYRDWVIEAFNQNMSFDQFTIENLAGDLLPAATAKQKTGSGFNRCNITTNEGGAIKEEYAVLYTRDRTETTAIAWLGLTAGCAVCHDHKFDPISQREFYELAAFFNNTTQDAMDGNIKDTPPVVVIPQEKDQSRWSELESLRTQVRMQLESLRKTARREFDSWVATAKPGELIAERKPADLDELFDWWLGNRDRRYQRLVEQGMSLEREVEQIKARGTVAHVMQESETPPMAHLLVRGEYDQRGDAVQADTPDVLPAFPVEFPRNRLGLAMWLLEPEQPLTARVVVNRFWQEVFGTGLVKSSGDFGVTGELPSHPALLDWLAVEFRETDWDVKRLFKLMVMSATYRQSAVSTPEKLTLDPDNRLLARGPRFRMDAEMVRDYSLAASGLLDKTIGGASVKPYQPPGVWEAVTMPDSDTHTYKQDSGNALYRRSMYTFWKRSAPPASLDIFNAPSREHCVTLRERTNTPLQALVTLNDPQYVESARYLAEQTILSAGKEPQDRIQWIAERILGRQFRGEELAIVQDSLARLSKHYQAHTAEAEKLIAVGESPRNDSVSPVELATWTMTVNELLNLDEVLCK